MVKSPGASIKLTVTLFSLVCAALSLACGGKLPAEEASPAVLAEENAASEKIPPYIREKNGDRWILRANPAWENTAPASWSLVLYYSRTGPGSAVPGELSWKPGGSRAETVLDFYPKPFEDRPLVFNSGQWGELPEEITIKAEGFEPLRVEVESRSGPFAPLNSDPGTMLYYPRSAWRNPEYELFTHNLYPQILYLVSGSFSIQSRFLKRLAFFVEKPGFAGRLARDEETAGLRDWYAHDYRARDMARFFDLVREQNFPLNQDETLLGEILLAQGIIKKEGERIVPGEGALVGLSAESRNRLPVYCVHETIHGLEFTMPELQKIFSDFFDLLSPQEKDFIKDALSYREYNVNADRNLLVSETAAYLLQQRPEETDTYFRDYFRPWYIAFHGGASGYTDETLNFLDANPGIFGRRSAALEPLFLELTGLKAENFYDLLPRDRSL
jgi:hypothetical protein